MRKCSSIFSERHYILKIVAILRRRKIKHYLRFRVSVLFFLIFIIENTYEYLSVNYKIIFQNIQVLLIEKWFYWDDGLFWH